VKLAMKMALKIGQRFRRGAALVGCAEFP